MRRFQFPLERALEWRRSKFRLEQSRLAALEQEKTKLLRKADEVCAAEAAAGGALSREGQVSGEDLARLSAYRDCCRQQARRLRLQASECDARIRQQHALVISADRDQQLLEKLRERQHHQWTLELNREIENTASDLYLARWKKNKG